jgi:taurine dioxygenase
VSAPGLTTQPLSEHVGVEVRGLDLREPIDEAAADELRRLLAERHLLLFRDQDLAPADQVRVLALFGEPVDEAGTGAGHTFVSNALEDGVLADGRPLVLHADNMFTPEPLHTISLYGQRIDGPTAPTLFADVDAERVLAATADRGVDDATLAELRAARVLNLSGFAGGSYRYRDAEVAPHHPRAVHPAVAPNPRSGRPALRISEQQSDRLVDWDPDRSEAVLQAVFAAVSAPGNVVEHHWRTGDLVVWDNRALQHGRPPLPGPSERTLRRVSVVDEGADEQIAWTPVSLAAETDPDRAGGPGRRSM